MTIDELSRASGVTTRNIRAYQERGLLNPPKKVGRTGYYGDDHLARLQSIVTLLDRGYSLSAIGEVLGLLERGGDVAELVGLGRALSQPWVIEQPGRITLAELLRRFPPDLTSLSRAVDLGLLEPDGDAFNVPSPQLLSVGEDMVRSGIPMGAALDSLALLREDADRLARRFVALFVDYVWEPFVAKGMPADELVKITETAQRLRPTVARAVEPAIAQAMDRAVQETTKKTLEAMGAWAEASAAVAAAAAAISGAELPEIESGREDLGDGGAVEAPPDQLPPTT